MRKVLDRRRLRDDFEALRAELRRMELLSDAEREERRTRAPKDFRFFCETYFPHLLKYRPSAFHEWFFGKASEWAAAHGGKTEIAAPRGNAKTTFARMYVLWRLVRGDTHFVIFISDTVDQAQESLEAIKIELEENPRLARDFPEVSGFGRVWQAEEIVTKSRVKIKVYGSGKRIRGANYQGHRPDLIVLDDLENDENVRTKEQRDKLENWFSRSVMELGPPDGSAQYLYIGTILHYDSLMMRVKGRGDFAYHKFKALINLPARMDLWERWERIWREDTSAGKEAARKFYEANREEMDRGAKVLWPEAQPLYYLMEKRAANRAAFNAEYQNEPLDEELAVFRELHFYQEAPRGLITYGAVDPALGKTRGDLTAIVVVGRDRRDGKIYVLHADLGRYPPMKTIARMIECQRRFRCVRWAVEEVAFQEMFKQVLVAESMKAGVPIPAVGVRNRVAKEIRIESLAPHVENGVILFNPRHTTLIEQLQFYPLAEHDDGPDALEMAFRLAFSRADPRSVRTPKRRRTRGF